MTDRDHRLFKYAYNYWLSRIQRRELLINYDKEKPQDVAHSFAWAAIHTAHYMGYPEGW